jgi:hypothetical protein
MRRDAILRRPETVAVAKEARSQPEHMLQHLVHDLTLLIQGERQQSHFQGCHKRRLPED